VLTPLARLIGSANERFTNSEVCPLRPGDIHATRVYAEIR